MATASAQRLWVAPVALPTLNSSAHSGAQNRARSAALIWAVFIGSPVGSGRYAGGIGWPVVIGSVRGLLPHPGRNDFVFFGCAVVLQAVGLLGYHRPVPAPVGFGL